MVSLCQKKTEDNRWWAYAEKTEENQVAKWKQGRLALIIALANNTVLYMYYNMTCITYMTCKLIGIINIAMTVAS